jgi:plastocyanin
MLLIAIALLGLAMLRGGSASGATASRAKGVDIDHFAFHPPTLRIEKGGRVAFTNSSNVTHTASDGSFDTNRIQPGTTKVVRFNHTGTFAYHCKIHPFMTGKIVVE